MSNELLQLNQSDGNGDKIVIPASLKNNVLAPAGLSFTPVKIDDTYLGKILVLRSGVHRDFIIAAGEEGEYKVILDFHKGVFLPEKDQDTYDNLVAQIDNLINNLVFLRSDVFWGTYAELQTLFAETQHSSYSDFISVVALYNASLITPTAPAPMPPTDDAKPTIEASSSPISAPKLVTKT